MDKEISGQLRLSGTTVTTVHREAYSGVSIQGNRVKKQTTGSALIVDLLPIMKHVFIVWSWYHMMNNSHVTTIFQLPLKHAFSLTAIVPSWYRPLMGWRARKDCNFRGHT